MIINIAHAGVISEATPISVVLFNILNFLLSVFSIIAILSLVFSGIVYMTSSGNENQIQKAKKMTIYSILGIVIGLGSMIIIKQISSFFG